MSFARIEAKVKTLKAKAVLHAAIAMIATMMISACAADSSEDPIERRVSPLGGGPTCVVGPSCPRYNEDTKDWDWWGYWCQEGEKTDWFLMWCENEVLERDIKVLEQEGGDPNVLVWKGHVTVRRATGGPHEGSFNAINTTLQWFPTGDSGPGGAWTWFSANGARPDETGWTDIGDALWSQEERRNSSTQDVFTFSSFKLRSPKRQTVDVEPVLTQPCQGCRGVPFSVTLRYGTSGS